MKQTSFQKKKVCDRERERERERERKSDRALTVKREREC